ncbi:MAG: MFS transporter [Actinobacteria bacterium]|nr:MFS transporter [Actinomycetota bacterium]
MPRKLIALLAIGTGATVANLYYAQPLLSVIASQFGVSDGTAGLLVTVSQVFYGLGIVFLAPLSDLVDRRKLVATLLAISCVALVAAAAAPQFAVLALAIGIASATSVVAQILVPFASTVAPEGERGHVVGLVMGGLLTGILLARTFSGLVAGATSWRVVFAIAAVAMAVLALALWRAMPVRRTATSLRYGELLGSVGALIRREPVLRRRMAYGACGMGSFSLVWTTLSFLLSDPPFEFGEAEIGLFGLAGLVGALTAMRMGRLHDRGHNRIATGAVLAAVLVSWPILILGQHSVVAILVGLALLDFGVQGQNVLSQGAIYALGRATTGRVTTAYVTANFSGGAIGSAAGAIAWSAGGWGAVCGVGLAFAGIAMLLWLTEPRQRARRTRRSGRRHPAAVTALRRSAT